MDNIGSSLDDILNVTNNLLPNYMTIFYHLNYDYFDTFQRLFEDNRRMNNLPKTNIIPLI